MTGYVILNPAAGGADNSSELEELVESREGYEVLHTRDEGDARRFAAEHASEEVLVIAAGGDGTLHEVVNGLWEGSGGNPRATLGIVPLGTGNDFARTICIPDDPAVAFDLACKGARRRLDLIDVTVDGASRVAINVCAGGFSGAMNERLSSELKQTWGPLAYLLGAAATLPDLSRYRVTIAWGDGEEEPIDAFNIVVANGRTAGGGAPAAPLANPEDGELDVVIVRQAPASVLGALVPRFLSGDYLEHDLVVFRRTRSLKVSAVPGMWFNADGELVGNQPISFSVIPGAIETVIGPRYSPSADDQVD